MFPLIVPATTAVIGVFLTRPRAGENGLKTINCSFYISAIISAVLCTVAVFTYLPTSFDDLDGGSADASGNPALIASVSVIIGIVLAAVILALTGYFTGTEDRPVQDVGKTSLTGAATVILSGISVGFESAVYTALVIGAAVYGAFLVGGSGVVALFCIALAGCGLLTTVGVIVAMDTFGPVSDNAQGIAEMSGDVHGDAAAIPTELFRRRRQHDQGDHQGHHDRDRRAGGDRCSGPTPTRSTRGAERGRRPRVQRSRAGVRPVDAGRPDHRRRRGLRRSPAWRSTPSAAPPARSSTRYVASSATSPGS